MVRESKKIKILYTIPNFDTAGSGRALLKVAQNLDKDKFTPEIMCLHAKGDFFKVVASSEIPVHVAQFISRMKPYHKGIIKCYKISKIFKAINPDIIHSFHYGADYSEPLAAKLAGIKWVYTKKNMNWGGPSKNGWKLRTWLATRVIAQNTDMIRLFFKNKQKIHLISRGVDTKEFFSTEPVEKLKKEWNLDKDDRVLMCIANLVPVKGIEVLINAFANISNTHKQWLLFVVGDYNTTYGQELIELAERLGIQKRVLFTGKQQNINEYLSLAEVFVLPSLSKGEGSPVSLLEAKASEKNVLASNIPGVKDQLKEFPNHLVEAGNIEAWEIALQEVLSKQTFENRNLGKIFRAHVLKNFGIENEVYKCEQLYLEIV